MKRTRIDTLGYEEVWHFEDAEADLDAIIAIHDTRLGPAVGGCRMRAYASREEALADALALSRGMTFKNAIAATGFGGGKAVIRGTPGDAKVAERLRAFGRAVESLEGRYVTGEDVGIGIREVGWIGETTQFVAGTTGPGGGGDPSPFTARGVFDGMKATLRHRIGHDRLAGLDVMVLGIGKVGWSLCERLHGEGAHVWVADVDENRVREAQQRFGAVAVDPREAHAQPVDIFAPCAVGGSLTATTVAELEAKVVAGAANNQLGDGRADWRLMEREVLYAPDYVINAGGVISVALEARGTWSEEGVNAGVDRIGPTLEAIYEASARTGLPTGEVANRRVLDILRAVQSAETDRPDGVLASA